MSDQSVRHTNSQSSPKRSASELSSTKKGDSVWSHFVKTVGIENVGLSLLLAAVFIGFSLASPRFLSVANFESMAFQLPELGILTLAMLLPILTGGLNLAITFSANFCGLTLAWILTQFGGTDASVAAFIGGCLVALLVGALSGYMMGSVIAYTNAHPILVSLAMMIFLRGLGEFLTRGKDISGFPDFIQPLGHGSVLGIPIPLLIMLSVFLICYVFLAKSRLGLITYLMGSNIEAVRYSGIHTKRALTLVYTLSGVLCAVAGIVMMLRFNSVRVGHGESYLLITVLACFLGGVDPFGGFGRVVSVLLALVILQALSSGLNLIGINQHFATAAWGLFLIAVMVIRWGWIRFYRKKV
ncbi:ABC transporter permease [Vibrio penaeicida]|uniref:ABC transporter permease n=1 Tax=Vibrio penaeicida TaxID=104609 RepID=UPI0027338E68|nr:ABC transporter permease [Vibrio penaeicida]MDP2572615.1 ABC transporter permease [Vibrio penaeicida]